MNRVLKVIGTEREIQEFVYEDESGKINKSETAEENSLIDI
jgi:hypothetical protein